MIANPSTPARVWPWRLSAGALILVVTAARLLYLVFACPLDLAPDEAHYWDWSRHLDWSYYSKGPLVAYLIRASCEFLGPLSQRLVGSEMLAVRFPAVLCGSLLLLSLYVLTAQVFRSEKLALAVLALSLALPVFSVGAILMTIDAPYACCWSWALVTGYVAAFRGSRWAWLCSGLLVGAGILAKYTMVLWLPSLGLFLLASPAHRHLLLRSGFWVMVGVSGLCCLPIVIWNAQHGWVTLLHLGSHAGWSRNVALDWLGPLVFLGGQFALLLGYWFVVWLCALWHFRPTHHATLATHHFLWWMSAPMFLFFFLFSLHNGGGEVNWPITAYLSGLPLGVAWMAQRLRKSRDLSRPLHIGALLLFSGLGLTATVLLHRLDWLRPALVRLAGPPSSERPLPLRRWDPSCRLRGWRALAAEVDRVCRSYPAAGIEPLLATTYWNMAGELGFYCQDHPHVYSLGQAVGDRHSQYDLWRPNPLADPRSFRGRTFILVGFISPAITGAFDRIEPAGPVNYEEDGVPIANWHIYIAHGFRGLKWCNTSRY